MPLKVDALEEPQLNLTPMIDVVFNLIIFFMVGTTFTDIERQLDVKLPQVAAAQPLTNPPDEIIVNVDSSGQITVTDRQVTLDQLRGLLTEAKQRFADQAVMVRADGRGAYQNVADVLAVCQQVGISQMSLAAQLRTAADAKSGGGP
jgi:biopolymer transport protein ExbD